MAVDWSALTAAVNEIRPKIKAGLDFVAEQAAEADEKVGNTIVEHIAANVPKALEFLAKVQTEIDSKSLTLDGAKAHFEKLKAYQAKTREEMKPVVAQLPPAVVEKIKARLEEDTQEVSKIAHKIYDLLK